MAIRTVWIALRKGKELRHPETWKNRQTATSIVGAVLGAALVGLRFAGVDVALTSEDIMAIAGGVATVGGLAVAYLTTATSKKVGIDGDDEDRPDQLGAGAPYDGA
jgi:cation transporter-like permease